MGQAENLQQIFSGCFDQGTLIGQIATRNQAETIIVPTVRAHGPGQLAGGYAGLHQNIPGVGGGNT
jgi:hypothetical protein